MVNRIDNTAMQSRITREPDVNGQLNKEISQKIRQQADDLASRQLTEQNKLMAEKYREIKRLQEQQKNKESVQRAKETNLRRKKPVNPEEQVPVINGQRLIPDDPTLLARNADAVNITQKKVTVDNMKADMQADLASTAKLAAEQHAADRLKSESDVSLVVEQSLQKDRHRERDNTELQTVIINATGDRMQEASVQTAQKELLTNLSEKQNLLQQLPETDVKTISTPDRQLNYPFKSWQGDPSVNIAMAETTIARASDDNVQRALRENQSDWPQDTPLIITRERDDQQQQQQAHRSRHDENGDDE